MLSPLSLENLPPSPQKIAITNRPTDAIVLYSTKTINRNKLNLNLQQIDIVLAERKLPAPQALPQRQAPLRATIQALPACLFGVIQPGTKTSRRTPTLRI